MSQISWVNVFLNDTEPSNTGGIKIAGIHIEDEAGNLEEYLTLIDPKEEFRSKASLISTVSQKLGVDTYIVDIIP